MDTLTANSSGILKNGDGGDPLFSLKTGKRYALTVTNPGDRSSGAIYPKHAIAGTAVSGFPATADGADDAIGFTMTGANGSPETFGFEFVAVTEQLLLSSSGFTEGATINVSVVRILP